MNELLIIVLKFINSIFLLSFIERYGTDNGE